MIPQEYQIPYDELELGRQLGKGELKAQIQVPCFLFLTLYGILVKRDPSILGYYGDVHLGTYNRRYDPIQVACKMIRPEGRARDFFNEGTKIEEYL